MKRIFLVFVSMFMAAPAMSQDTILVQPLSDDIVYFEAATDEEQSIIRLAHKALDEDTTLWNWQKRKIRRLLKKKHFVRKLKKELTINKFWENPEDFEIVENKLIYRHGVINWEGEAEFDIDRLKEIIEIVLELISLFSDFFVNDFDFQYFVYVSNNKSFVVIRGRQHERT